MTTRFVRLTGGDGSGEQDFAIEHIARIAWNRGKVTPGNTWVTMYGILYSVKETPDEIEAAIEAAEGGG